MLEKIGKYEIRLQIGRGAMGVVYEAWDAQIERRVALKTLRIDQAEASELPELLARFKREAQAVGRLSHPHIVTIHDYGVENGTPYIVMEYVKGRELAHDLARHARFPLEDVARIMTQMLGALAHAHEQGVVHRDLKPANMFLLDDGSLKVVDFGIARVDGADFTVLTSEGRVLGTPAYMSPEQVASLPVDHRADLFSAGVILYELLVGERPFTGESVHTVKQKVLSQEPLQPSAANPSLSPAWDRLVARALAKKPAGRFESARQFAEAIKAALQADRAHAEEARLKAAEANEHALRAAEERARAESLRLAEAERREAQRVAKAEAEAREAEQQQARRKAEEAAKAKAAAPAPSPEKPARSRAPVAAVAVAAAFALGAWLYTRTGAEDPAAKLEAARVAAEAKLKDESERRAKAEALARDEAGKRSRLEAEARAQAEQTARAKAEEEARKAADEKAKALLARKEEEEKRKAELAAKKEVESKARAEAEAKKQAELAAQKEAEEKARTDAARKAEEARQVARKPGTVFQDCSDCPRMVVIPAGEFTMGSPASEAGRDADEGPQRTVRVASLAMGRIEVTVAQFRAFADDAGYKTDAERNVGGQSGCFGFDHEDTGTKAPAWHAPWNWRSPGFAQADNHPVVCVSWNDAVAYARWLSRKTGKAYRLPSEAEWEYAARAGTSTARYWGDDPNAGCRYGNVRDRARYKTWRFEDRHECDDGYYFTAPVGGFTPNRFGLYDVLGNAWEWTQDCVNANYNGAPTDGSAWLAGDCSRRVARGGGWSCYPRVVRSANRVNEGTANRRSLSGFRLARTLE